MCPIPEISLTHKRKYPLLLNLNKITVIDLTKQAAIIRYFLFTAFTRDTNRRAPVILPIAYIALKQPYSRSIIPNWALIVLAPGDIIPEDIVMFTRINQKVAHMHHLTFLDKRGRS